MDSAGAEAHRRWLFRLGSVLRNGRAGTANLACAGRRCDKVGSKKRAAMPTEEYIPIAVREFERLKRLADQAITQLPAEQIFATPGVGDNCVAVIVKHVSGNMRSRWQNFLSSDGEKPDRKRDLEFTILPDDSRERLLAGWEEAWSILFAELRPLRPADLCRRVTIRGETLTVLQAINRQLTHYAYHVGQIVYIAKHFAGSRWQTLSIPVGGSERFNQAPKSYLQGS